MLDAISAAQAAMLQDQFRLQSISQNVSNMQTPGYKRQIIDNKTFDEQFNVESATVSSQIKLTHQIQQGTFIQSKNPAELAISGAGFFEVQNDQGVFYTRRGDFHVNAYGELVTSTGAKVLGKSGVVHVDDNAFVIDAQGNISIDNQRFDQINLVNFTHPEQLDYQGESLYASPESPQSVNADTRILQGYLEQSNVKSIDEMMDMVKTSRHFEASQRVMRIADSMLSTAINQLGEGNV